MRMPRPLRLPPTPSARCDAAWRLALPMLAALAASVLLIGSVGATLAQPVLIFWVIDRGVLEKDMNALSRSVLLLLGAIVAEAVLSAGHQLLFAWFGERYLARMRSRVFEHLSQLSLRFYDATTRENSSPVPATMYRPSPALSAGAWETS